jgi:hypothetical protein
MGSVAATDHFSFPVRADCTICSTVFFPFGGASKYFPAPDGHQRCDAFPFHFFALSLLLKIKFFFLFFACDRYNILLTEK